MNKNICFYDANKLYGNKSWQNSFWSVLSNFHLQVFLTILSLIQAGLDWIVLVNEVLIFSHLQLWNTLHLFIQIWPRKQNYLQSIWRHVAFMNFDSMLPYICSNLKPNIWYKYIRIFVCIISIQIYSFVSCFW